MVNGEWWMVNGDVFLERLGSSSRSGECDWANPTLGEL